MRYLRYAILALGIIATSWLIITGLSISNLLLLVPWDTALVRPEIGSWQRTLNDFFEGRTGETMMLFVTGLLTILPLARTLYRRPSAIFRVLIANLLLFFGGWMIMMGIFVINNVLFPVPFTDIYWNDDPFTYHSYARSIIPMITLWILYGVWFREIRELKNHRHTGKQKAKNSDYRIAESRLSDSTEADSKLPGHDERPPTKQTLSNPYHPA